METNEQYLKDFIFQREESVKFSVECSDISEKAHSLAIENIKKYEELQKEMEIHNRLMEDYKPKQDKLTHLLRQVEEFKNKANPQELASMAEKEANAKQKLSDKVKKQWKDKDITNEQFIQQYMKTRTEFYQSEALNIKLKHMNV